MKRATGIYNTTTSDVVTRNTVEVHRGWLVQGVNRYVIVTWCTDDESSPHTQPVKNPAAVSTTLLSLVNHSPMIVFKMSCRQGTAQLQQTE